MVYSNILSSHSKSQERQERSTDRLNKLRAAFLEEGSCSESNAICVFAAGSLGRLDCGESSDLDVFVTSTEGVPKLKEIEIFASILGVNSRLQYPPLSNDGEFLKIFDINRHAANIGSAHDDSENYFTTRMLLLLESNYLVGEAAYANHKRAIIRHYWRDAPTEERFKPVFLINDILRYWRTVCLNYERARNNPSKSWKKKNFNLKYSRMLSVFGTVLPLVLMTDTSEDNIAELCSILPMQRLARGLDSIGDVRDFAERFEKFLDNYEFFLRAKEDYEFDSLPQELKDELQNRADFNGELLFDALTCDEIPRASRRYLVI